MGKVFGSFTHRRAYGSDQNVSWKIPPMGSLSAPCLRPSSRLGLHFHACTAEQGGGRCDGLLPREPHDGAGPLDSISRQPSRGAPEARPAPHCAAPTKRKGPGEAAFSRIPAAAAAALILSGSSCRLLFASGNMVSGRSRCPRGGGCGSVACVRGSPGSDVDTPSPSAPGGMRVSH